MYAYFNATLSKRTFLGKTDYPDIHFVRPSAFIVRTTSSARFYPADAVLPADGFLPHPRGREPRFCGHGKNKIKNFSVRADVENF
jgi:hypothetical protein